MGNFLVIELLLVTFGPNALAYSVASHKTKKIAQLPSPIFLTTLIPRMEKKLGSNPARSLKSKRSFHYALPLEHLLRRRWSNATIRLPSSVQHL